MKEKQGGFTLVELSIVLVILGLLVGGVLTGQSLIRAAELRSVMTQEQRYITAIQTFRDKYFALPGDMPNATAYWGAADGSTGNTNGCETTASTNTKTCNGDGNGIIQVINWSNEPFRLWQHLANAGLIEGFYNGADDGVNIYYAIPQNSPASRISSSLWYARDFGTMTGSANSVFAGVYGNAMSLGGIRLNNVPTTPIFKAEEVYNIDAKMDDGKPATGKVVIAGNSSVSPCTDTTDATSMTANYALSTTALSCAIIWRAAF